MVRLPRMHPHMRDVEDAALVEITDLLRIPPDYPRDADPRERPHPGPKLDAFEERDGYRYTAHATDTPTGQLAQLRRRRDV